MNQQKLNRRKKPLKDKKIKRAQKSNRQKKRYRIRNWPEYNEALKQRDALDIWIDECIQEKWHAEPTRKRGSPRTYSK